MSILSSTSFSLTADLHHLPQTPDLLYRHVLIINHNYEESPRYRYVKRLFLCSKQNAVETSCPLWMFMLLFCSDPHAGFEFLIMWCDTTVDRLSLSAARHIYHSECHFLHFLQFQSISLIGGCRFWQVYCFNTGSLEEMSEGDQEITLSLSCRCERNKVCTSQEK